MPDEEWKDPIDITKEHFWGVQRKGKIYWILRPELQEAIQEIDEKESLLEITIPEEIDVDSTALRQASRYSFDSLRQQRLGGARSRNCSSEREQW